MNTYKQMCRTFMYVMWFIIAVIVIIVVAEAASQVGDSIKYFNMSHIRV